MVVGNIPKVIVTIDLLVFPWCFLEVSNLKELTCNTFQVVNSVELLCNSQLVEVEVLWGVYQVDGKDDWVFNIVKNFALVEVFALEIILKPLYVF